MCHIDVAYTIAHNAHVVAAQLMEDLLTRENGTSATRERNDTAERVQSTEVVALPQEHTAVDRRPNLLEQVPTGPSVDGFLSTAQLVLSQAINANSVSISKDSDLDVSSGKSEVSVRSTLPDGTQLEARRSLQRHSVKWKRIYPYVVAVTVLIIAILLTIYGGQWLDLLSRIFAAWIA